MKDMAEFFDDKDLIGHKVKGFPGAWDFGDCSAECGRYWFGIWVQDQLLGLDAYGWAKGNIVFRKNAMTRLEGSPGVWRRHPDQYNEPEDYSRDQQLSIQCLLAVHDEIQTLKRMIFKQWRNFGRYQNADIRTWEWAIDARCLGYYLFYPLIACLDLGLLINVLIRAIKIKWNKDDVADDLNLTVLIIFCNWKYPTPLSWLAKKIFAFRDLKYAWSHYYRHDENPPLDQLYFPIIEKLKSHEL